MNRWPPVREAPPVRSIRCTLVNGDSVTVLVADGEPNPWHAPGGGFRIVRRDGTVIVDDVVEWTFSFGDDGGTRP